MGKAITYCNTCQTQIREADFERGTAFRIEDRAYCQKCSGEALKSLPPEKVGALLKEISSRSRKAAAAPAPPSSARIAVPPPPPKKPPLGVVVGAAAGVAVLLTLIFTLTWPKATPIEAPVKPTVSEARKPAVDEATPAFERLSEFAATSTDPEAILQRCQEARPKLRGTKYEARLEEIEKKAKETWDARLKEARFTAFLASVATMRKDDPGFERRAEIQSLIRTGLATAGPKKPAVEQVLADYDRAFLDAARAAAEKVKTTAAGIAAEGRYRAAAAACDDYPGPFRETEFAKPLLELKAAYEGKLAEAARLENEKRSAFWSAWKIASEPSDEGLPKLLPEWANRKDAQKLRPPCSFERALDIPAGKGAVLSLWGGREDGRAGWTLSVTVDKKSIASVPVGPDGRMWKPVFVDLSSFAGKKALLRLEGAGIGSSVEPVYVSSLDLRIVGSPAEAAALIAREQDPNAAWTISCSPDSSFLPAILPEYQGRTRVTQTHPHSKDKAGTLERDVAIPAKKKAALSFWVNHAGGADWELRVVVDGTTLKKELIGGELIWRQFSFDLSPYAGRTVKISLQNAANDWSSEFAYWSDITVAVGE